MNAEIAPREPGSVVLEDDGFPAFTVCADSGAVVSFKISFVLIALLLGAAVARFYPRFQSLPYQAFFFRRHAMPP